MTTHATHAVLVTPGTLDQARAAISRAEVQRAAFLARYRNEHTRAGYAVALDQWFRWCYENHVPVLEAERGHVELFLRELELTGRKLSTVSAKFTALVGFYRFAVRDGALAADPTSLVDRPRVERRSGRQALTRFETAKVVATAEQEFPAQVFAFIAVLAQSGLRVSEACGIDVEHLDQHRGTLGATIVRKGGKTRKTAGRIVTRVVNRAGITGKHITPHSFRHGWCTMARDAQIDPRAIQAAGGWADSRMMDYYDSGRDDARLSGIVANGVTAWIHGAA